jgi:hypothetical protein
MQILLLGDEVKELERVKKRLWMEGVLTEVFFTENWSEEILIDKVEMHQIILFCTKNTAIDFSDKKWMKYQRIFILIGDDFEKKRDLKKSFKYIFSEPVDYFNLSFLIKSELFNLQRVTSPKEMYFKNIVLNLENRNLISGNKKYFLRNKEFALMRFFLENPGRLLTRMSILENVWDINADLFTNTVDVHVSRLRKLLKDLDAECVYIKTIPCSGYVFE